MSKAYEFLKECGAFFVLTVNGDCPAGRPFGAVMEPTLNHTTEKIFKGFCGTSFSAPHVTHMAARLERALEKQLGQKPSANLIRAMLANSAKCSPFAFCNHCTVGDRKNRMCG